MRYFSYMAPESVVEGFDAGMIFPSFNSTPSYGEEVVVVANALSGVVGYVIKFTHKVPNYIARRTFVEKPEVFSKGPPFGDSWGGDGEVGWGTEGAGGVCASGDDC